MHVIRSMSQPPPPPPPPPPKKKKPILLILIVIVLLIVIIGGIAAFFFFKGLIPGIQLPFTGGETGGTEQQQQPPSTGISWNVGEWVRYETNQGYTLEIKIEDFEVKQGVNCVKIVQKMEMENGEITMTFWLDPTTRKVVWWHQLIKIGTQTIEKEGPGAELPAKDNVWVFKDFGKYLGEETITVPAGTFKCKKYSRKTPEGEIVLWVNDQIPITKLVKSVNKKGGQVVFEMELVAYGG